MAVFTASGIASGIDTASIVDNLVKLESAPITRLQKQQAALTSQVSAIGSIISALSSLRSSATSLGSSGVMAASIASSNTAFTTTAGSAAQAGRYSVQVDQLATAAKWRSNAFTSGQAAASGGTITLKVNGTTYDPIKVTAGESLADVAYSLRNLTVNGAAAAPPISATILAGKDGSYLSVTSKDTGFSTASGGTAADALAVSFAADGSGGGTDLSFGKVADAQNALFSVDGLAFQRQSNTVTDAIPGLTLNLAKGAATPGGTGTPEDLVVTTDTTGTQANLQKFVDAYNGVMSLLQAQLNVNKDTDRASTLAGDAAVRSLQGSLQKVLVTQTTAAGTVRSLADLGVKTAKDGSLTIDGAVLTAAIGRDPGAVNDLFSASTTGVTALVQGLVDNQTRVGSGVLTMDQQGLNARIDAITTQTATLQLRIDAYRTNLVSQFTAMESTISNLKTSGSFLTNFFASYSGVK
jgi:flagellar hook-associated protein 2